VRNPIAEIDRLFSTTRRTEHRPGDSERKLFGRGFKVAVEVAVMAADSGAISMQHDIIALGGSSRGADVACVIKPAHSNDFFSLQVQEIIAMPQEKNKS